MPYLLADIPMEAVWGNRLTAREMVREGLPGTGNLP